MAKLILSLDGQVIKEHDVNKERMTIGRKPHNDIQIDNLAVSGEHAMIMTILNDSFLEDLGSTNGTMVNGQPVKKHFLQSEDVVEIGKYKLKYVNDQAGKMTQQEFEKTMVLRAPARGSAPARPPSGAGTHTNLKSIDTQTNSPTARGARAITTSMSGTNTNLKPVDTQTSAPTSTAPGGRSAPASTGQQPIAAVTAQSGADGAIQILSGPNAGRELPLSKPLTTVGKPGVQVAVIAKRPQGFFITHVEGANFPVVNGKPLSTQAHQLQDHDIVELAGVKMEFFLRS
jgi:pSer/pThr/pTyr-binding forkhead associated (FHA) protein